MTLRTRLEGVQLDVIRKLSSIAHFPDGLLPHTVFVEEEGVDGVAYSQYKLTEILSDGSCRLLDPFTMVEEERALGEINIDWLLTVWDYYCDLYVATTQKTSKNENHLEQQLRLLLDIAVLELPGFEQSDTYAACSKALEENAKELYAFTYSINEYSRNVSDVELINEWRAGNGELVERMTPDEFACYMNDEMFNEQECWVRFIKM